MYVKGELMLVDPPCNAKRHDCDHKHEIMDTKHDYNYVKSPCAYLEHSCDDWVIGGPEQIEMLISDLKVALLKMRGDD